MDTQGVIARAIRLELIDRVLHLTIRWAQWIGKLQWIDSFPNRLSLLCLWIFLKTLVSLFVWVYKRINKINSLDFTKLSPWTWIAIEYLRDILQILISLSNLVKKKCFQLQIKFLSNCQPSTYLHDVNLFYFTYWIDLRAITLNLTTCFFCNLRK